MLIDTKFLPLWSRVLYLLNQKYPDRVSDFANSFSQTQQVSKEWLISLIDPHVHDPKRILILGGWYGTYLLPILLTKYKPERIVFNDIDPVCCDVVNHAFGGLGVHTVCNDVIANVVRYNTEPFDLIINTSCEHMDDMTGLVNVNQECVYAFQSANNTNDPGHINPSTSGLELFKKSGMVTSLYSGSINVRSDKKRIVAIGKR
jgi:hypothetical protein